MHSASKRKATMPGLGERAAARDEKATIREEDAVPESRQNIACPPAESFATRATVPASAAVRVSTPPPAPASGRKPKAPESRPSPVRIDRVGGLATKLAARTRQSKVPRLSKTQPDARSAPLDPQSAYVLSLIDGHITAEGLADATGMPEDRVEGILERLERLGFVTRA